MVLALVKPSEEEEAEDLRAFFRQIDVDYSGGLFLPWLVGGLCKVRYP